jgi:hypothetical protein
MVILDTTTALIQIINDAAGALDVCASYVDFTTPTTFTADGQNTLITTAATTTVVGSPGGSTIRRNVTGLNIRNSHATVANTVTVKQTDGTTAVELFKCVLQAGEIVLMNEAGVWFVYDTGGGVKTGTGPGRWRKTTVLTSGTTFTTQPGVASIFVRLLGGGGGGGGCTSVASSACGAGGGGGGGYAEKTFAVAPSTAYTYAIGAAGTGVSGAAGNNGGNTTFTVGGVTVTAFGGTGAPIGTATTTLVARAGGAGGVISTNGDVNSAGSPGEYGVVLITATPIVASGNGGNSDFGGGGLGLVAVGNGNNAVGFGAGGGGSATGASAVRTGGNGAGGMIIVDEYS